MYAGRWSEDREGYPRWPDDPAREVRVIDPVGAAFANLAERGSWRRESWTNVSTPPPDDEVKRLLVGERSRSGAELGATLAPARRGGVVPGRRRRSAAASGASAPAPAELTLEQFLGQRGWSAVQLHENAFSQLEAELLVNGEHRLRVQISTSFSKTLFDEKVVKGSASRSSPPTSS